MKKKFGSIIFILFIFFIAGNLVYGQMADLEIRIKCPGKAKAGQDLKQTINVYVTNSGKVAAKNFPVDLIISKDANAPMKYAVYSATFKEDALLLGGREFVSYLGPGQTKAVKLYGNNRIPADTPTGAYFLGAIVDAGNKVVESNERNNMDFCRMKVKGDVPGTAKPCGIKFTSMSKNSGYPGDTFIMYGTWGTTQGTKLPCINKGGMNKLIVLTWTNSKLKVRIPAGLAPGSYRVGVYCRNPSQKTYGTVWKDFKILNRGEEIDPSGKKVDIDITDIYLDKYCRIWIKHTNRGTEKLDVILRERVWVDGGLVTDDTERIVLLPGRSFSHGVGADPGVIARGTPTAKAQIDVDNVLAETNEVNNIKVKIVRCPAVVLPAVTPVTPLKPLKPVTPILKLKPGIFKIGCPDPAAFAINFQIVNRFSTFTGKVRITGVVKNVGSKAFSGGGGMAYLYEGNTLRKTKSFSYIAPGATFSLFYERNWNASSPNEGEFPPKYKLVILYDPDILMDSNKNNDDCKITNNRKERSGSGINSLFR